MAVDSLYVPCVPLGNDSKPGNQKQVKGLVLIIEGRRNLSSLKSISCIGSHKMCWIRNEVESENKTSLSPELSKPSLPPSFVARLRPCGRQCEEILVRRCHVSHVTCLRHCLLTVWSSFQILQPVPLVSSTPVIATPFVMIQICRAEDGQIFQVRKYLCENVLGVVKPYLRSMHRCET